LIDANIRDSTAQDKSKAAPAGQESEALCGIAATHGAPEPDQKLHS
jgi:hypothetical protein